jgi:hypothetical protein
MVAATEIIAGSPNHGDMSSMLYLRDHVQAANALMELHLQDPTRYNQEGRTSRTLFLSALHLMSTPSQLARFDDVITRGTTARQEDWPHISLLFNDLEGLKPNGWRNKQDTFQMLADATLDAVENGLLTVDDLAENHKQFLGSIVPLLVSVGFPAYENSGSWEEITAHRTSVLAVETSLLYKMKTLAAKDDRVAAFLRTGYGRTAPNTAVGFDETLDTLLHNGLFELGRRLPDESPDNDPTSIKFRQADAALTYVLMYDLPRLLASAHVPIGGVPMEEQAIEQMILAQLSTLVDPDTNGIARYEDDSYQRVNYHTNEVAWVIKAIKRKVKQDATTADTEVDLDQKQTLRGELTPQGKTAAWTHPLGQLAGWAAKRSLRCQQEGDTEASADYRDLSTSFLNRALSTVTGNDQWHAVLDSQGYYHVRQVPAYKLPECYVAYQSAAGETFTVPSPHTPLNWSSAALRHAIGLLRVSTARASDEPAL